MWPVVGTLLFIALFVAPSILAHTANIETDDKLKARFGKLLYAIYGIYTAVYAGLGLVCLYKNPDAFWFLLVTFAVSATVLLSMFGPFRVMVSGILTFLNSLASLNFIFARFVKPEIAARAFHDASMVQKNFLPNSIAQLNGWILFLFALGLSLQKVQISGFGNPHLSAAVESRQIDLAAGADFFSALLVAVCGVGIFISRNPKEVLFRLSLVKPGKREFLFGVLLCIFTFFYDYLWSLFTHAPQQAGAYSSVMRSFNEGSYMAGGDMGSALFMASAIGLIAGFEEEITNRGAIQPALGIVPAAFLHAVLHSQFDSAPLFIVQIFGWSAIMGTVKYYTNTTTTIIAHLLFNFLSCFLIGFNP